jgi:hypothetical protein
VPCAGRPRAAFWKLEECHLQTLLRLTASPAGRAAPQKLAYEEIVHQEIERSAASERRETGPRVERARIRPLALFSSLPVRFMRLTALCNVHISAGQVHKDAQTRRPLPLAAPRILK